MKKKLIQLALVLTVLLAISLVLQLIPLPDWLYIMAFVIVVVIAALVGQAYERVIGREAQGDTSEASVEQKDNIVCKFDRDVVCYHGHIIPVSQVYIKLDGDEVRGIYRRIDKVYNN
jgi:membrane protein implicated in regulation of membrane protease activity